MMRPLILWIVGIFWITAMSLAAEPTPLQIYSVTVGSGDPTFASEKRIAVSVDKTKKPMAFAISYWGELGKEIRTPTSVTVFEKTRTEIESWKKAIVQATRPDQIVTCQSPVRFNQGNKVLGSCLDGLATADRKKFFAWFEANTNTALKSSP